MMALSQSKYFFKRSEYVLLFCVVFVTSCLFPDQLMAQESYGKGQFSQIYLRGGLSLQFGSHQNRVGLHISAATGQSYVNVTFQYHMFYTFKDYGYYEKSFQHIAGVKMTTAFSENSSAYRAFSSSPFSNQYFYEFHYLYRYYFNKWNTNQPTGQIGLNFGHIFLLHENDLLAAKSVDKFRTAAMRIGFQDSVQNIATSFVFWTGNKDDPKAKRFSSSDFSRYGYFDLSETALGRYSHGILAIEYGRQLPFANQVRISAGYDHEKIRNAVQNKFMHDLPIWPRKWNTAKSRHVPMVDQEGNSFLYGEGQTLREGKFYWGFFLNSSEFY